MPWYTGKPLLAYLEQIAVNTDTIQQYFTMPVQRVCRPDHSFRGFQGQIESGSISVGDEITVLPSRETSHVRQVLRGDQRVDTASVGQAVTIQLDSEIDVSRGCVLTKGGTTKVNHLFSASILWMDDSKLVEGKSYLMKVGTGKVPVTVLRIRHKIDVNSGHEIPAEAIYKNEIAVCDFSTSTDFVFDTFLQNKSLGSLILIDRVSHMTSACGTITRSLDRGTNLTWQNTDITREFRENQLGQKACTIWLTGLSGAGKSTLANALEKRLAARGKHTMLLDGDNIRMGLNRNLGFSETDRIENIRRIAEVAKLMNEAGLIVFTSFISPFASDRRHAREIIGDRFIEIYVSTPLEECARRDVKGLYAA